MIMTKLCDFGEFRDFSWPEPGQLKHYFLAPPGKEWLQDDQNDGAILMDQAAYGTENLPVGQGRIKISLQLWGKLGLGVLLVYSRLGGGCGDMFSSKGDMRRIREWGAQHPRRPAAYRALHSLRAGISSSEGVHRDRRRVAEEHRVDRKQGPAAKHFP
jgi:hypothetical protein